MVAMMRIK